MNTTTHGLTTYWLVRDRAGAWWCVAASVVPDMPYLVALAVGFLLRVPAIVSAMAHGASLREPLFAVISAAWATPWANFLAQKVLHDLVLPTTVGALAIATRRPRLQAVALGWTLHVVADLALHANDAYPVLWPFTLRVFPSPVSYWDPAHHGRLVGGALALLAAALWALAAWTLWRRAAATRPRTRRFAAAACALLAVASAAGAFFGPTERGDLPLSRPWVEDGIEWPDDLAPIAATLAHGDAAAALAQLRALPAVPDTPGALPWERHYEAARRRLLEAYALDLAGSRPLAVQAYRDAEALEPVGNVGDKARRYEGEPFRDVADPPVSAAWALLLLFGLASAAMQWWRLPMVTR